MKRTLLGRRRGWLGLATATWIAAALTIPARTVRADGPAQQVKPVVLFLLDTSGSMEYDIAGYLAESGDEDVLAVPVCTGVPGAGDGKSRYIAALEVLTGAFSPETYACEYDPRTWPPSREDRGYPVPHVVPVGTQVENGLIDIASERFKFGVMTFDAIANPSPEAAGGYSYGPESPVNYGARNSNAATGWFVPPSASDDRDEVLARNAQVEASIVSTIPYGGTPLAPILRDALYFFQNDPAFQPYDPQTGQGDLYSMCRSKNVVLITDGRATLGEGTEGYLTAATYAGQLLAIGVKVYVIGFQLPAGVQSLVDAIAQAGGTQAARIVSDPAQLATVLSKILGNMETSIQSRTRIAVTQDTGNFTDRQYQFSAAYGLVEGRPGLFRGYLERSVYQCVSGDQAAVTEVQSLADRLAVTPDADRTVYTMLDGRLERFEASNSNLTLDRFGIAIPQQPGQVLLERRAPNALEGTCDPVPPPLDAYSEADRQAYIAYLIRYIRVTPDSCRYPYKLGAIVHSSPVIQGHLKDVDVPIPSFQQYKNSDVFRNRPTVLYVGTHDGMLHAFQVSRPNAQPNLDWGKEIWAFIPNQILKRLKDLPNRFQVLMDGEPVVKDILLSRTIGTLGTGTEAAAWRSVLVTGYGEGGRGYVALDVTDPENPSFLWEISPEGRWFVQNGVPMYESAGTAARSDFSRLGSTFSRAALGNVFLGSEEVAVAVFGAGARGDATNEYAGRSVFVVRLDTGEKLAEFGAGVNPSRVVDPCGIGENTAEPRVDLIGDVTCYSTFPGTFITRCFLGDRAGRLWRVDLGQSSTAQWKLQLFFDPYDSVNPTPSLSSALRAPASEAPAVAVQPYGANLVVVYGGGDPDRIDDFTARSFVASLTEMVPPAGQLQNLAHCSPFDETVCRDANRRTAVLNWKVFFGCDDRLNLIDPRPAEDQLQSGEVVKGERLMGAPVIFSNTAYFTTFAADTANACNPGIGWLWGVDFQRKAEDCMSPRPLLDVQGDNTITWVRKVRIGGQGQSSIPYGLTVAQKPACFNGEAPGDVLPPSECANCTPLASLTAPKPQVVVQTAVQGARSMDTLPASGGQVPEVAKATRNIINVIQNMLVSAWGFVFD